VDRLIILAEVDRKMIDPELARALRSADENRTFGGGSTFR
jgi:hypothetical protein